ncbi:MAG: proline racemase family protein [Chloroflexota bacterium]|nr:proline racemase family protein [Chloroflexia bacterium]MDQ3225807.1 proline racemase family protein [Chloroflexota bacterium]
MRFDRVISTIDAHAAGEPLRIITAGVPPLPGATVLDRRRYMAEHYDHIRRTLLFEPRGHADMYGAVLTPAVTPDADYGVLFLTNEGYSTMCGHGIIALTTVLLETGMLPTTGPQTNVVYDSPAGLIRARATTDGDRVTAVAFRNVPAFRFAQGVLVTTSAGTVRVDVAFGGALYALVDAAALGVEVLPENSSLLTQLGMEIKRGVMEQLEVVHPEEPELRGIYGTIISESPRTDGADGRNITVYAEGAVDRSPCGTGTSAKLACLYADRRISIGQGYVHESVIGTTFTGRVLGETRVGPYAAVETEIAGRGFLTGFHQFVLDSDDPNAGGFLVR